MKLKDKFLTNLILLLAFMSVLSILVSCNHNKKGINSMSNNEKVTKIKIGETYTMSWSKSEMIENDKSFDYIKLLDDKTFMYVSDDTQHSKEYYRADGDNKTISIEAGTYEKEGDNFIQKTYLSYQTLVFSPDIDVKKGATGSVRSFMAGKEEKLFEIAGGTAIEKHGDYYRINTVDLKGTPSDALRISDVKLPDTVEEFLSQYKLTSDVKPQSYERTPEGQEKKAKMFDLTNFPVHREDDGTIWVGF